MGPFGQPSVNGVSDARSTNVVLSRRGPNDRDRDL